MALLMVPTGRDDYRQWRDTDAGVMVEGYVDYELARLPKGYSACTYCEDGGAVWRMRVERNRRTTATYGLCRACVPSGDVA